MIITQTYQKLIQSFVFRSYRLVFLFSLLYAALIIGLTFFWTMILIYTGSSVDYFGAVFIMLEQAIRCPLHFLVFFGLAGFPAGLMLLNSKRSYRYLGVLLMAAWIIFAGHLSVKYNYTWWLLPWAWPAFVPCGALYAFLVSRGEEKGLRRRKRRRAIP